jgi:transposase
MRCQKCGHKFVEELSYVKKNRKFTNRMIEKIIKEVINSDISRKVQLNVRWNDCIIKKQCQPL